MALRHMSGSLLVLGRLAGCACLPRAAPRVTDHAQRVHQPLLKRQRTFRTLPSCTADRASASVEDVAQQAGAPPPPNEQQDHAAQLSQMESGGADGHDGSKSTPKKQMVAPTPVVPPRIPGDTAVWESAVLLIDKPKGWTSFDVCGKLRHSLAPLLRKKNREVKVGHAGTLDPMATGLLIVCVGRATKAVDSFMAMRKQYSGTLRLGEGTPSYDAETEVAERAPWQHITDEDLARARQGLVGEIQQLPPMYSAIKVGGKKLYEAARKGKEVERQPRAVTVERFDMWRDAADPQSVHFWVTCSKGTYIRSLAYDLGKALGSAAHLTALRREAIGEYRVDGAWDVQELAQQIHEQRHVLKQQRQRQQQQQEDQPATAEHAAAAVTEPPNS